MIGVKKTKIIKFILLLATVVALFMYYLPVKVEFAVVMADEQDVKATVQISLSYQRRIFGDGVVNGNVRINDDDYVYRRVPPGDDIGINDIKYLKKVLSDKGYSDERKDWFHFRIVNNVDKATVYIMPEFDDIELSLNDNTLYKAKISDIHYLTLS